MALSTSIRYNTYWLSLHVNCATIWWGKTQILMAPLLTNSEYFVLLRESLAKCWPIRVCHWQKHDFPSGSSQEKNLATLNTDLQLVGYVPWLMRVVSEKWCKRAHKLTKKIFWHIFYILWFGSEFSDKRKGFHFFNFRKNAAAGTITLTGMAQRILVGKIVFQTVAARRKRRTVEKALKIFIPKLYVKLFSCINLFDF